MEPLEIPLWAIFIGPLPLTIVLFTKLALPSRSGFATVGRGVAEGFTTSRGRKLVLVIALIMAANSAQAWIDPGVTRWLGWDMTPWVRSIEGDWIEHFQAPLLDHWGVYAFLTWVYVCAYVGVLLAPPLVWTALHQHDAVREHACGFLGNYVLAMPFYFLFPVVEVGWADVSQAVPLMDRVIAGLSEQMRYESALDNCFPSLHVSCSVTAALICQRNGPRGLRIVGWAIAGATAYTVMALGVHWLLDVLAGIPFGILNAWLGVRVARKLAPQPASVGAASGATRRTAAAAARDA